MNNKIKCELKEKIAPVLSKLTVGITVCTILATGTTYAGTPAYFNNVKYTTSAYGESWQKVVARNKVDNEQTWYCTFTKKEGNAIVSSKKMARLLVTSDTGSNALSPTSGSVPVYKDTKTAKDAYCRYLKKGTKCKLYVHGNENCHARYRATISGRYFS